MNITTKIIATTALLLTSLNASAFKKDFVSETLIPADKVASYQFSANATVYDEYLYAKSLANHGYLAGDLAMFDLGQNKLKSIANEHNYGQAMFAIGYHLRYKFRDDCGRDRKCKTTPRREVLDWLERAEKLDNTGQVAFEIAGYWLSMGRKVNGTNSDGWAKIGRDKSDAYHSKIW